MEELITGLFLGSMFTGLIMYFFMHDKYIWNLKYDKRTLEAKVRSEKTHNEFLESEMQGLNNKIDFLRQEKETLQNQIIKKLQEEENEG